ncbi:uncharacterized protein LOC130048396 [Ostrea edulis]|uniref:uncharacterized protein LOC130048396 n=1 Tax=Ostrea edulis TaxID=37623 RepID=UPI0024AF53E6|nr:uncharacterized protein LOC130048396 [Ostrea edulis]
MTGLVYLAVLLLLIRLPLVCSACLPDEEPIAGEHWDKALNARLNEQIFKMVPKERVRAVASAMQADLQKERKALTKLREVTDPVGENLKLDPEFLENLVNLTHITRFDVHNTIIGDLSDSSNTHFLKGCFGGKEITLNDDRNELNSVVKDVITCAGRGVDLLLDLVNIFSMKDEELTTTELIRRMQEMGEIAQEIKALVNFLNKLKNNVEGGLC